MNKYPNHNLPSQQAIKNVTKKKKNAIHMIIWTKKNLAHLNKQKKSVEQLGA